MAILHRQVVLILTNLLGTENNAINSMLQHEGDVANASTCMLKEMKRSPKDLQGSFAKICTSENFLQ